MTQQPPSMNAAQAWSLFWSEQGQNSRCLALSPDFCERLDAHWHSFASTLPEGATVIDLGCGSGAVGKALRSAEPALRVIGVDAARIAPSQEPGLELIANVAMEALPFPTASFAAAVSQFGYEYAAAPDAAAREVSRVVAPGGSLSFLIHHDEGPIVAAMRRHRRAIEGLCGPEMRSAFNSGDANRLTELIAALRQECANDPLVEAAGRGLQAQVRKDEASRARVWSAVVDALSPELVMLHSLDLSAAGGRSIDQVMEPLAAGFDLQQAKPLRSAADEPIAWIVEGSRRH
jgi:SAM-dependent methyltransferase